MDYNSIHGPGISNFSSPSPHRMPTVSAAQALQDLNSSPTRCISTGLSRLDCILQNQEPSLLDEDFVCGGVSRGKVTEVYGPPGVGKTTLGLQLTASALHAGQGVIWVDGAYPVSGARLSQILSSYQQLGPSSPVPQARTILELAENLTHFAAPTISHLIALLAYPTPTHPPSNTSLIIIDSFSTLVSNAFPKNVPVPATARAPTARNPSSRKFPILQYIINALQKLAAMRNIAIVIFSQCVTKMRPGNGAVLIPSINITAWEQSIWCRVVLFRDWGYDDEDGQYVDDVRMARVMKAEGAAVLESQADLVGFKIEEAGLKSLTLRMHPIHPIQPSLPTNIANQSINTTSQGPITDPVIPQKRKFEATDFEIPDSDAEDDEDYGWGEEDEEELPPPPPQWQGSEDILIPDPAERDLGLEDDLEEDAAGISEKEACEREDDEVGHTERVIVDSEDELA